VNSVFSGNFTTTDGSLGDGGAIGTDGASTSPDDSVGGDVYICGTQITGNQGYGNGGGAYLWVYPPDRIIIDRTTVSANRASPNGRNNNGLGGAMRVSNGEIIIRRSSFLSNTSDGNGGGLYLDCAPSCTLNNDTFHGNIAKSYGGAIFGDGHSSNNVTFAANQAGGHGGAIFGSGFSVSNSVFLDNAAGNPWGQAMSCSTTGTGANVVQWLSAKNNGGSDTCVPAPTAAPALSAPADNGGPTWTMLPARDSPLLNAGSGCTTEDQRGNSRDTARCDLGSVEIN
jgi:predicted outer membrane repeat protein